MGEIELLIGGASGKSSSGGRSGSGQSVRLAAKCKAFCWVGEIVVVLLSWTRSLAKLKACSCDGEMELFIV